MKTSNNLIKLVCLWLVEITDLASVPYDAVISRLHAADDGCRDSRRPEFFSQAFAVTRGNQHRAAGHGHIGIDIEKFADLDRFLTDRDFLQIAFHAASGSGSHFPQSTEYPALGDIMHGRNSVFHRNLRFGNDGKERIESLGFPDQSFREMFQEFTFLLLRQDRCRFQGNPFRHDQFVAVMADAKGADEPLQGGGMAGAVQRVHKLLGQHLAHAYRQRCSVPGKYFRG